ncbi:MAG: FAD-dependent oxidoreductase [Clostridia bacterium]|nr:FAD-dependent oxidoreductase [Clostridia bacterium]
MIYQKELPVRLEADVVVAGGGASGVAAAVAAARMGKSVLLAEAGGALGGVGTSGMVPAFAPFDDGVNVLCGGIGMEIRRQVSVHVPTNTYWTPIDAEELKRTYDKVTTDAGVKVLFFTTVCDVLAADGHIEGVVLTSKTGLYAVKAKVFVDCTGDGTLNALGGGAFEIGNEEGKTMPPTLCSQWAGVDKDAYWSNNIPAQLEKAIEDGVFTYADRHLSGMFLREGGVAGGNIGHIFDNDPLDEESLTKAMMWGRASMMEYMRFYREYIRGCENVRLVGTGAMLGIRESRRTVCDYMLSVSDYIARADFADEIGRYCYPVDIHIMNTKTDEMERFRQEYENMRYEKGESYGIPYRSLTAASWDNLLTAGRCMGTDRQMEASIRVMPGCFITGEAAGTAAALAADHGTDVRGVDVALLQRTLAGNGAYVREELIR